MKVLFVSTRYHPHAVGGAEATVRILAEGLVRAGDEATVVTLAPDGRRSQALIGGVRVHYLPLFNVFFPHGQRPKPTPLKAVWQLIESYNPVMAARLAAVVDAEAPDVVNIHNVLGFSCAIWPMLASRGLPVVQTLHDHYVACTNSLMHRSETNCAGPCLHCRALCAPRVRLSRHVGRVTTVSARLWERLGAAGVFRGVQSHQVIYNCNADLPATVAPRRRDHGAPLRLGFLGRLEPIKGPDLVLEAVRNIGPRAIELRLGGDGRPDDVADLKRRFAAPNVTFLGRVAPAEFFPEIDLLVVPSRVEEALGRVVHEAYGFGVPVVGVSIGGIPEIIRDGVTGFLVRPNDAGALERLLHRLLADPPDWAAMSEACLREAERFTFDRIFAQYRTVWESAAAAPAPVVPGRGDMRLPYGKEAFAARSPGGGE